MRIIRIAECIDCPHADYYDYCATPEGGIHDSMVCQKRYRAVPANGIPDWCPLESDTV